MPSSPNKLSQFWQELKRRNVVRVITVYAGAAFVILELVDIIAEPLKLPSWLLPVAIVLLSIGLIIAIILSWIYDIHPEGGMVKTEPAEKVMTDEISKASNSWKIASYISFVVILGLIMLNIIPGSGKKQIPDKSIAVLPFRNESSEESNTYFINGTMESILDNLCRIKDLRVPARTSVEQYRDVARPISDIARELNVSYLLEGSGQKIGNRILLTVQLIDGSNGQHIWSRQYDKVINKVEDQIDLQSKIAQLVAGEIQATITPLEKELIENIPTINDMAYEFYQKGRDEYRKFNRIKNNTESLNSAESLFRYALEYDSTFSWPYDALARLYWTKVNQNRDLFIHLKDSVVKLTDKALHFDPDLASAYCMKGIIYKDEGKPEEAVLSFEKAISLNPNMGEAYWELGMFYLERMDYLNGLENLQKSILRDRRPDNLRNSYDITGFYLSILGFSDIALEYYNEYLNWHGDTTWHILRQAQSEQYAGNYNRAIKLAQIGYERNPNDLFCQVILGETYQFIGQHEQSLKFFSTYVNVMDSINRDISWRKIPIAYSYLNNGYTEKAEYLIEQQIKQAEDWIGSRRVGFEEQYWYLAMAYALKQDSDRVNENLNKFLSFQTGIHVLFLRQLQGPIFYGMKDNNEFMEIFDTFNTRYQATIDRVRQWLQENDVL